MIEPNGGQILAENIWICEKNLKTSICTKLLSLFVVFLIHKYKKASAICKQRPRHLVYKTNIKLILFEIFLYLYWLIKSFQNLI